MIARLTFCFLLFGLLVGASCRAPEVAAPVTATHEVRDDLGRTVRVPEKVDRVISLAPSLTEMIFAAGAGNKLVGVTTYCNYPEAATTIEKIGDTQTPNIEKIIALKPQVVFVSTDSQLEAFSKTLDEQGIAVYVTNPKTLDEIFANLQQLGQILDTSERAEHMAITLTGRVSFIRHQANYARDPDHPRLEEKQRVFVQISNEPLFTIGKESFLTDIVEKAGGVSVTRDVPTGYPTLSKETAAALNPDVIFLSDSEDNREPNAAFKDSKAVKNGRVYRINADIISRPGPRLVDALEEIALKLKEKN
jgi:iron complex transport system substrate-binding protein